MGLPEKKIYYPMLVSSTGTENISREEDASVWKSFLALPKLKQDILTDEQMPIKIAEMKKELGLPEVVVGLVSAGIRKIFLENLSLSEVEENLKNVFSSNGIDQGKASKVVQYIEKEILTIKPKPKVEEVEEAEVKRPEGATVRLPLLQALSKYEQLGNQLITRERIKIRSQAEPVRPSLLYWIKYYRDELGIGHHDSVQRGDFLFRSENGKRLSLEERERVNLVLKSVEENLPLEIDTERSEIVFPAFETLQSAPRPEFPVSSMPQRQAEPETDTSFGFGRGLNSVSAPVAPVNPGALSFTSKHVFPAERSQVVPEPAFTKAPAPKTAAPAPSNTAPTPFASRNNPFRIRPVSLGKEE